MNPYEVLEVATTATEEEIRAAYKKKAMKHHPDRGGDEEQFKDLKLAYEVLSESERRKKYDETGSIDGVTVNSSAELHGEIINLINQVIESRSNMGNFDLFKTCKMNLDGISRNLDNTITRIEQEIAKRQKVADRITRKSGENVLKAAIETQVAQGKAAKAELEQKKERVKLLGDLLEEYVYEFQEDQPVRMSANFQPIGIWIPY